jgi:uncharacterized protein YjdB
MKKVYLFLFLLLLGTRMQAQTATAYGFTAFTNPYVSISSTGTVTTSLGIDDVTLTGIPIGFSFTFCGISYTAVSASSNGWLSLANSGSVEYNNYPSLIPSAGFLAGYWDDLSGQVSPTSPAIPAYYSTTGSSPNRIFTFEWKNWSPYNYTGSVGTGLISFQIKLYEGTNVIDYCYGPSTIAGMGATIGIANSTSDWQTLPNVGASPTPSSSTFTNTLATSPAANQVYRWQICLPPVIQGTASVCIGNTTTLTDSLTGGTWVSSVPGVATIGASSGVVTGVSSGTTTIAYTSSPGCVRTTVVTVTPSPSGITGTLSVCQGNSTTLSDATTGGTWSSSNTGVATIGVSNGTVDAVSAGTSTITYKSTTTGCYALAIVTVNSLPADIGGVTTVCTGGTTSLSDATAGGTWSSSTTGVATVGITNGVVAGVALGTATITYTAATGCYKTKTVTVSPAPSTITGTTGICVGGSSTLSNTVAGGTWNSSNGSVAVVGVSTGIVTGVGPGTSMITYATGTGCMATAVVTVTSNPGSITGTLTVCAGATTSLSSSTGGGTWGSSATGIATVGATTGVVTGVSAGSTPITYTGPTGCYTTAIVTVNASPAAITGPATACVGGTSAYSSTSPGGLWYSSNTSVATIGLTTGVVTGVVTGTVTISYTFGATGCSATKLISVNPAPNSVTGTLQVCVGTTTTLATTSTGGTWVSGATSTASVGATTGIVTGASAGTVAISYVFTATGCASSAIVTVNPLPAATSGTPEVCVGSTTTLSDATPSGTWSSGATAIATINSSGVVTGNAAGTAAISYTLPTGCVGITIVTVDPLPSPITGTMSICQGTSTTLSDASAGGLWTISPPTVAIIGGTSGIVTGVSGGTASITYTLPTTCFIYTTLTVIAAPASTGTATVCQGSTTTLSNSLSGGTWSSGSTGVATVGSASGIVTGVAAGTAGITYTFASGCNTVTIVTVNPLPAAITGSTTVCAGQTTTLSDATAGGSWFITGGTAGISTIGTSAAVLGITSGTATISYSLSTGCAATVVVTVLPLPAPITGSSAVCEGATITLADATAGGTWASGATGTATIGIGSGIVTGVAGGTTTITYTDGNTGCFVTKPITVNATPPAIGGPATVCVGATVTETNTITGGTWSSSNTVVATIDAAGVVTGGSSGTTTITFVAPTGCLITRALTVNPLPSNITGSVVFCQASTITLSDLSTGGTWSSGGTGIATVGLTSGIVTGVSGGTTAITYTLPTTCGTTTIVTVNPLPATITGNNNVCLGLTTTLSNTTPGGTWTSSNGTIAPIGATTGIVTGSTVGNVTITYTLSTGCLRTTGVTVNPLPTGITGTATVCSGSTTTLSDASAGGTWTSSNTGIAFIDLNSGVVTGGIAGTATITYKLPTTCITTTVVTVNPLPALITGVGTGVCLGSTITLNDATPSGTWSSSNTANAAIGSATGIVSGLNVGTTTITYQLTTTGCLITRALTVNPLPLAITGPTTLCGGAGTITLSDATPGGTWTSSNTGIATADPATGVITGGAAGLATITYTLATGCYATMGVSVNPIPPAVITTLSGTTVCPGSFVPLTANTGAGLTYQWFRNGVLITGVTASSYIAGASGSYQVKVFNTLNCPALSAPKIVTIDTPVATVTATGGTATCVGGIVTLNANTGAGLTYQWVQDGIAISGATADTYDATAGGTYNVVVTNSTGCWASDTVEVTVNALPIAIVSLSGPLTFCDGGSVTMTATSGAGYTFQWNNATGPITGATNASYTAAAAGSYWVTVTNAAGCTAASVVVNVVVNALPNSIVAAGGPTIFCTGGSVTLQASTGAGYSFQWYRNAVAIPGATNVTYTASVAGNYRVRVTNTSTGCMSMSTVDKTVTVVGTPTVTALTSSTFCWGGSSMLGTSVPTGSGLVSYQWYLNSAAIAGATNATYNATVPGNYTCSIAIAGSCTQLTAPMAVTERPLPNPMVSYNATTHMLSTQNYFVTYQWYKDLVLIAGATTYQHLANGNANYKVAVTDTNGCQSVSAAYPLTTYVAGVINVTADEIKIFPNPATQIVHITANSPVAVTVRSLDGKMVLHHDADINPDIDISALANGIYLVSVSDVDGQTVKTEHLVKDGK